MDLKHALRNGMRVIGPDDRDYGTIDRYDDAAVYVQGRRIPLAGIGRLDRDRVYLETPELWQLTDTGSSDADLGGETRVPLLEERLEFGTRAIELGDVRIHKTVEEAEEVRRGPLNRDDVQIERVRVDRRVDAPEVQRQEGEWLVIPIMEEVFVVEKHLVVTEEIRIRKQVVTEEAEIREKVRRERASVEDTRVPRTPLLTEPDVSNNEAAPRDAAPAREATAARDVRADDDEAWEDLHRAIREPGR